MTREEYVDALKTGVYEIVFTKVNGEERFLRGTLKEDLLPKVEIEENAEPKKERAVNPSVVAVFDLDAAGFRSFKLDSVKRFEKVDG